MTTKQLCCHIIHLMHAPIHVYDGERREIAVYLDNGEQQDILTCDTPFLNQLLDRGQPGAARLYLEADQLVYGVVCGETESYVMGPCCVGRDSIAAAKFLVNRHQLDPKRPYRVFRISLEQFTEMVLMMQEMVNETSMDASRLWLDSFAGEAFERSIHEKLHTVIFALQENNAVHNPYSQEMREQESIRTGNLEALEKSFQETYVGKLGVLSNNSLRNAKDLAIVLVTLASRSAIAGGVLPEISFSMSDAFVQRVEELRNEGEVLAMARQAEVEYCKLVKNTVATEKQHPLVVRCKELIFQNLHTKLSVQDLAARLEISPSYLSQLFAREEGINLSDYIAREKVNFSKQQLLYTNDSYEAVAYAFGFFSQSHYGRVFKKWTGMTPRQFREQYHNSTN